MFITSAACIDVIIPSFRMDEGILLNIFNLPQPRDFNIKYLLICDNPDVKVPSAIQRLADEGNINLIINTVNIGSSQTRNKGIDLCTANWILFLDDDIIPSDDLLLIYAAAITEQSDSLGFAGITEFPQPFNTITTALVINGVLGHFCLSRTKGRQRWSPTSNIMLNRRFLGNRRFLSELNSGGEDVELLVRNSIENNNYYLGLPAAAVKHPWWNNGKSQLERMFRYGAGNAAILKLPHIKKYSSLDFTNTCECVFILLIAIFACVVTGGQYTICLKLLFIAVSAEYLTNLVKAITATGKFPLVLAWQMALHKNAQEVGFFSSLIIRGDVFLLFRRIDFGFNKPHPSPFRLNKWKIIKLTITIVLSLSLLLNWSN